MQTSEQLSEPVPTRCADAISWARDNLHALWDRLWGFTTQVPGLRPPLLLSEAGERGAMSHIAPPQAGSHADAPAPEANGTWHMASITVGMSVQ